MKAKKNFFLFKSRYWHPYFPKIVYHTPLKRIFDVFFSFAVVVILLPIYLVIGLSILVSSRCNPLYKQKRIGRGGKPFHCYKFRTMIKGADSSLKNLLSENPQLLKEWETFHKLKFDPRVTRIGKFLRKTSLDELPQFFNVLKGDLSVVGPRAVVMQEIETHFKYRAKKILKIRPGVTGLWQISGRSDVNYAKRVMLDEGYVDDQNILLDLKIVLKTIPVFYKSKGAY